MAFERKAADSQIESMQFQTFKPSTMLATQKVVNSPKEKCPELKKKTKFSESIEPLNFHFGFPVNAIARTSLLLNMFVS